MGLFQKIFGGKSSGNKAYEDVKDQFAPLLGYASEGAKGLSALLGGDQTGFNTYMKTMGFDPMAEGVSRGITGNAAAGGLLRSGSTGTRLQNAGQQLKSQFGNSYIQQLLGLSGIGLNAGQALTGAGQYGTEQSGALGGTIGKALSLIPSDPRLKMNVEQIGSLSDGLNIYTYSYIWEDPEAAPIHVGVMADEVADLRPWALGPEVDGFMTVDYSKLDEAR